MSYNIKRVCVIGSGVMGTSIAAHFANAGIPSYLLDIVPKDAKDKNDKTLRNKIALDNVKNLAKSKPAALYVKEFGSMITCGNIDDNLDFVGKSDLVIEAIIENLEIKKSLFKNMEKFWKTGIIVATNTSGISVNKICEDCNPEFKKHFLGMHFFNPPRYMKLLELIPAKDTLPEIVKFIADFGERRLGKGIVYAKDTPNFIANRIGMFAIMDTIHTMINEKYSIEEIDKITGSPMGHPSTASFRTIDLVGLDTFCHVANNMYEELKNDEKKDTFILPAFIKKMFENKWLGNKTKQGFYKKVTKEDGQKEILTLDYQTLEYKPKGKVKFGSLELAANYETLPEKLNTLVYAKDRAGQFAWSNLSNSLIYSATRIPEISDNIVNIDNAMKWGFNWELGPFEVWDAIGVEKSVGKMKEEGRAIPAIVEKLLAKGFKNFYKNEDGKRFYFDFATLQYKEVERPKEVIILKSLKDRQKVIKKNSGASVIDLGDNIIGVEFHTKMNAIGPDIISMLKFAVDEAEKNYKGVVVANEGQHFSVGANLMLVLLEAQEGNWDEINIVVKQFQDANMKLKYSKVPVVVAPFGYTFGGGCEIAMHGDKIVACAETYIGLVELGVGVIPAGGGTKEMLLRNLEQVPYGVPVDSFPFIRKAFENIGLAKVATSAEEARQLRILRDSDIVVLNKDYQIYQAKMAALGLYESGYKPPRYSDKIFACGRGGIANFKMALIGFKDAGFISEYDMFLGEKLAYIICGGNHPQPTYVTEQNILDLEREVFVSLCGQKKTQDRMQAMLKTGKPLRN